MGLPEGPPSAATCKHLAGHLDTTGNYILRKTIINAIATDGRTDGQHSIACPTSEFGQFLAMDYQVGGTAAGGKFKLGERWNGGGRRGGEGE